MSAHQTSFGSVISSFAQQVRIHPMLGMGLGGPGRLVDRRQAHQTHQAPGPGAAHPMALPAKPAGHLPRAVPRRLEELSVDQLHQLQVQLALALAVVVERRPRDSDQLALASDAESALVLADHRRPSVATHRPKALDKKSFSTVSFPILAWSSLSSASFAASVRSAFLANSSGRLS